eukprot:788964-Prymnesium_polylepis.1
MQRPEGCITYSTLTARLLPTRETSASTRTKHARTGVPRGARALAADATSDDERHAPPETERRRD